MRATDRWQQAQLERRRKWREETHRGQADSAVQLVDVTGLISPAAEQQNRRGEVRDVIFWLVSHWVPAALGRRVEISHHHLLQAARCVTAAAAADDAGMHIAARWHAPWGSHR